MHNAYPCVVLCLALLAGCAELTPVFDRSIQIQRRTDARPAQPTFVDARPEPTPAQLTIRFLGTAPSGLRIALRSSDGSQQRVPCDVESERVECRTHILVGAGHARLIVAYRALDGALERRVAHFTLEGDEDEVLVGGYFDPEASVRDIDTFIFRRGFEGLSLTRVLGYQPDPGEAPIFRLENFSEGYIHVGGAFEGTIARVRDDGFRDRQHSRSFGGCTYCAGIEAIKPGDSVSAWSFAAGLQDGEYEFQLPFDDESTLNVPNTMRRLSARFEIRDGVPRDVRAIKLLRWPRDEEDAWSRATPPARPGWRRPSGHTGAELEYPFSEDSSAPAISSGDDVSGITDPATAVVYRLGNLPVGGVLLLRVFARCVRAPCGSEVLIRVGDKGEVHWHSERLHRPPPSWSVVDVSLEPSHAEARLVFGGLSDEDEYEYEGSWEFYGRLLTREAKSL